MNSPAGFGGSAAIGAVNQTSAPAAAAKTKKSTWEQLGNANQHVAQEKATTHVSINTHHSD